VAAGNAGSKKEEEPVRTFVKLAVLAGAAAALACDGRGRKPGTDELSADLRRDLDLASSASLGLASSAQPYQRMRVVSAIEKVPVARHPTSTARAPDPRRARPRRATRHAHAKTPAPAPTVEVGDAAPDVPDEPEAPTTVAETMPATEPDDAGEPAGAGSGAPEPQPAPRPRPIPIPVGGGGGGGAYPGRGPGQGPIGDVIGVAVGVVIRGGHAGIDHCDERDIAINRRFPVFNPTMGNPTFPRR